MMATPSIRCLECDHSLDGLGGEMSCMMFRSVNLITDTQSHGYRSRDTMNDPLMLKYDSPLMQRV